jgi:phytoene dehydrogenase-like protein
MSDQIAGDCLQFSTYLSLFERALQSNRSEKTIWVLAIECNRKGVPSGVQALKGLYCVGDSCFPGQGVNDVAYSGTACTHRVAADIGECE